MRIAAFDHGRIRVLPVNGCSKFNLMRILRIGPSDSKNAMHPSFSLVRFADKRILVPPLTLKD
jgi:hypothetical protein